MREKEKEYTCKHKVMTFESEVEWIQPEPRIHPDYKDYHVAGYYNIKKPANEVTEEWLDENPHVEIKGFTLTPGSYGGTITLIVKEKHEVPEDDGHSLRSQSQYSQNSYQVSQESRMGARTARL